jgi:hypothetical protein
MKVQKRLVSVYIDDDMYADILAEKKEDDSFNKTFVALVRQSLKERDRQRKKNAAKKVHS